MHAARGGAAQRRATEDGGAEMVWCGERFERHRASCGPRPEEGAGGGPITCSDVEK